MMQTIKENEELQFNFSLSGSDGVPACSRLLVVSNCLPVCSTEDGITYHPTKLAGIAPAIQNLKTSGVVHDFLFIGHAPPHTSEEEKAATKLTELGCVRVSTPQDLFDSFYGGFCKSCLWPLLHYRLHYVKHNLKWFESYVKVNEIFADTILAQCKPGDIIWIHDYHLMLLPALLRERLPRGVPIGFFFHVPFPSSELFRVLPNRTELLMGVLGSDLIGFQTFEYVRHFESSVSRLLGAECDPRGIESPESGGHFVRVEVFPGGIDFDTFDNITNGGTITDRYEHLKTLFKDKHVMVSRDRVDEIEGVGLKLHALETFIKKYPQWKGKVVLFQIYEPQEYELESEDTKSLQRDINETVGRLNGVFGAVDYVPIEYVNKRLTLEEICALYSVAQVALITPIRDGLNLVSHEYVACQKSENPGVLILSEFTGAARCLSGARLVNPFDTNDFAEAMNEALTLAEEDRSAKHDYDFEYIRTNTSTVWAKHFFDELKVSVSQLINAAPVPLIDIDMVACAYSRSTQDRLFFLDYDGTLSPMAKHPKLAVPSAQVMETLEKLTKNPRNKVFVISGRNCTSLESWLGHLDIGLAGEHGAFFKRAGSKDWEQIAPKEETSWRQSIVSVMEDFADRTPGSFVELKQINVAWHYRNSDPEYGNFQARELTHELQAVACKFPVEIIRGKKCIEVKPQGVNKGEIVRKILEENPNVDFVFCIGDDKTDEDMFAQFVDASRITHFTCCVMTDTKRNTQAKYWLESYNDVVDILSEIVLIDTKLSSAASTANRLFPPMSFRQFRRNSLLSLGAKSRDKKKYTPTGLLGSCGIVQQSAQALQE